MAHQVLSFFRFRPSTGIPTSLANFITQVPFVQFLYFDFIIFSCFTFWQHILLFFLHYMSFVYVVHFGSLYLTFWRHKLFVRFVYFGSFYIPFGNTNYSCNLCFMAHYIQLFDSNHGQLDIYKFGSLKFSSLTTAIAWLSNCFKFYFRLVNQT